MSVASTTPRARSFLNAKERRERVKSARTHRLFKRLRPCDGRVIVSSPHKTVYERVRTVGDGTIVAPARSSHHVAEYGLVVTVLAVGTGCGDLRPGLDVLVPMFAGVVVTDHDGTSETDIWVIGVGSVMAVLEDAC